jgi:hypothetical protein
MNIKQLARLCFFQMAVFSISHGQSKSDRLQILSFRLTQNRIVPAFTEIQKGKYLLRLSNGVTGGALQFELVRRGGALEKLAEKQLKVGKSREEVLLDLQPGDYDLRVLGQPKWVAALAVKP